MSDENTSPMGQGPEPTIRFPDLGDSRNTRGDHHDSPIRMASVREQATRDRRDAKQRELTASRATALFLLGLPALAPIVFMIPAIATFNSTTHAAGNDVLGTGGAILLFATLSITPLVTITGHRWFVKLRQWYGIMFALTVITDLILAINDPAFGGNIRADLTGHSFLAVGALMVCISIPLLLTANRRAMHWFGHYWREIQATGTYAIWLLLGVHLAILEGFGFSHRDPIGIIHQRFYQYLACSIPLFVFRLPAMKRLCRSDSQWRGIITMWLIGLFLLGYVFFISELIYKGVAAFKLQPIND